MEIKQIFESNYLSRKKFSFGETFALFYLMVCVLVTLMGWNTPGMTEALVANAKNVFQHEEVWRLFSTTFLHADIGHLLSNSLMLFILIYYNSSFFGGLFTLSSSFFFGAIINGITIYTYTEGTSLIGASGVLYYLWGFWLVNYFMIQKQFSIMARVLRIGSIFLVLLVPTSLDPQTSYRAHYIGLIVGMVWGGMNYLWNAHKYRKFEKYKVEFIPEEDDSGLPWNQSEEQY
tara:strand:+ start:3263 stop:3958 length:696 start_codon:yes stop_codon:yes gene_type:complete